MKLAELPARCSAQAEALSDTEIHRLLSYFPAWSLVKGALQRSVEFADFIQTMSFVNAVAAIANEQDHHPDIRLSYGHCELRFQTHSVSGISVNDFICAHQIDALTATPS